jgi:hypothetical protein
MYGDFWTTLYYNINDGSTVILEFDVGDTVIVEPWVFLSTIVLKSILCLPQHVITGCFHSASCNEHPSLRKECRFSGKSLHSHEARWGELSKSYSILDSGFVTGCDECLVSGVCQVTKIKPEVITTLNTTHVSHWNIVVSHHPPLYHHNSRGRRRICFILARVEKKNTLSR